MPAYANTTRGVAVPLNSADGSARVTQPLSSISADSSARVAWVQVQVEGSGKWPDNEEAAGKLRSALGCQIAQALESQFGMHARAAEGHVDVHAQGFVLRLRLWSDRDDALAERTAQVRPACMHGRAENRDILTTLPPCLRNIRACVAVLGHRATYSWLPSWN